MTSRYRTAFAAPSGFTTATAAEPRSAAKGATRSDRKPMPMPGAASGRPAREPKAEIRGKSAAA